MEQLLLWVLSYLGIGVSTNLFLFHVPVAMQRRDYRAERLKIARSIPRIARLLEQDGEEGEQAAIVAMRLGTVLLWPLLLVPLLRWLRSLDERKSPPM